MFPIVRTIISNAIRPSTLHLAKATCNITNFHSLSQAPQQGSTIMRNLLVPANVSVVPNCGFKVKRALKKRCKDCYFVKRENRLYVICETHPRHKQMQMVKKEKDTWILSHATQGKVRPW